MLRATDALVAQLVEHLICNQGVAGSNPAGGTTLRPKGLREAQPRGGSWGEACPAKPPGEDGRDQRTWYVYIIRSIDFPGQEYTGISTDLRQRMADHNAGKSPHTSKYAPWDLLWYCAFPEKHTALAFEKYLKSHSGRAFPSKQLKSTETDHP